MLKAKFEPGHGSLPKKAPHEAVSPAFTAASEPCRLRVLIVDDDASDIALIDRALRRMVRYEVEVASAGSLAAALWVLSTDPQDLLLVDYSLREECGTDLAREVSSRGASTPVIMLTSLWTADVEAEVLEAGGVACLSKDDLTPRIMETTVRQALRGQALEKTLNHLSDAPAGAGAEAALKSPGSVNVGRRFDIQSLAVDAVASWQRLSKAGRNGPHVPMRLHLMDHPIYVRASEVEFRSAFDWVFAALPLNAERGTAVDLSVFESGGQGEVVIEATTAGGHALTTRRGPKVKVPAAPPILRSAVSLGSGGGHVVEWVSPSHGTRTSIALPLAGSKERRA